MLSRFISRPSSHLRFLTLALSSSSNPSFSSSSSKFSFCNNPNLKFSRNFSNDRNGDGDDPQKHPSIPPSWSFSPENDNDAEDSLFGAGGGDLSGIADEEAFRSEAPSAVGSDDGDSWDRKEDGGDIFADIDKEFGSKKESGGGGDEWATAEGYEPWTIGEDEGKEEIFQIGGGMEGVSSFVRGGDEGVETESSEADKQIAKEEEELSMTLKGPNRAFGDLISASGITEAMLDSLIALKDLEGIEGLPPLREIEDLRLEKNERKSTRAEMERKKQEEIAKARVRQVDEKGRAYGTGRRKCSVARVWIQPGDGKFLVNDKQFDVYFPMLDHRADLLQPFSETKTLGLWDVTCTVKGGGVSGQVGAVRLGISRALQNWEPGLRPPLRSGGFLTRDPRVVERKKPGKAKARKSFQWVKR
ncbi:hypothetical protein MRB53_014431 [Persea americana]|uniref:Uncharacterized protein n=1 Tax=Persea americana TaxID=3435 RepID=A0ACC2KAX3_PERAE|nr:hypothetical protein MRB53_014431 [Persea americana]|eukprot:TRINITY_DN58789_c0_g1_i1.p1 TRINITY_DN58789_c0_g1~~TRINITY_DN58789_c0_g1_i1.p1  ORF type:complete len:416 (+),score=108.09 TRINITY_DN58789_c0_g1_i1:75-1322(+)